MDEEERVWSHFYFDKYLISFILSTIWSNSLSAMTAASVYLDWEKMTHTMYMNGYMKV